VTSSPACASRPPKYPPTPPVPKMIIRMTSYLFLDKVDRGRCASEWDRESIALVNELLTWSIRADTCDPRWLLNAQSSVWCEAIRASERHSHEVRTSVNSDPLERARIERQPQPKRRNINTLAK